MSQITTEDLLADAKALGEKFAKHSAAKALEDASKKLESDTDAQRVVNDFQRLLSTLAQKQASQQPIEPDEKRQLETLQQQMATHLTLRQFQTAQMDYLDLVRQVDESLYGQVQADAAVQSAPSPAQSPVGNPDIFGG